jgi:hypothetical protein
MLAHLSASADGEGGGLEVGKLLRLADRKAARRGRPDLAFTEDFLVEVAGLALDRRFVAGVAKGYLAGQLGAAVLDD